MEEVKCNVVKVKSDVVEVKNEVVEVKTEVVEVKTEVQEVKCMISFSSRLWKLNLLLRGADRTRHSQMVFTAGPVHKLQHCMRGPI